MLNPANPKATITQVKADDGTVSIKLVERLLRDAGLSRNESKSLLHEGVSGLRDAIDEAKSQEDLILNTIKLIQEESQ